MKYKVTFKKILECETHIELEDPEDIKEFQNVIESLVCEMTPDDYGILGEDTEDLEIEEIAEAERMLKG